MPHNFMTPNACNNTFLPWKRVDKNRWLGPNGKFIARFNWGSYYFLLYSSRREYEKEVGDYVSFDSLKAAKLGAAAQDSLPA